MSRLRFWLPLQLDRIGGQWLVHRIAVAAAQPLVERSRGIKRVVNGRWLQPLELQFPSILPDIAGCDIELGLIAPGRKPNQLPPVNSLSII